MICPTCGQADQVEKVSTLYVRGLEVKWRAGQAASPPGQDAPVARSRLADGMPADQLQSLTRRLSPPAASKKAPTRPIHPDMVVVALTLVSPIFLYGILTSQPSGLLVALPLLAGFYAFYFWQRKKLIAKYQAQLAAQQAAADRIERGVQRWMKLYYCARDDGVFEPGGSDLTPADQIAGYLFKQ